MPAPAAVAAQSGNAGKVLRDELSQIRGLNQLRTMRSRQTSYIQP